MKSKLLVLSLMVAAGMAQAAATSASISRHLNPKSEFLDGAIRVPGIVKCRVSLNERGEAIGIQVLNGRADLIKAALRTVSTWTFSPATVDGRPVRSNLDVTVQFQF
jgi:outer membrane biosynthesis protein TonB